MRIYLIRHGKTVANERHLYCGSTDLPLSEKGRQELQQIHYEIEDVRFLTSGMARANETMELLFPNQPYDTEPDFREVDFGAFEMRSYRELKDDPAYQAWITGDNEGNIPPGGESGAQMTLRVMSAFAKLQEDTCIITHGGVIAAIMAHLFPEAGKHRYQWQPQNGHGYIITENGFSEL
jgi:alpha-ribazole phosphatase